jgi:hypothetical protein
MELLLVLSLLLLVAAAAWPSIEAWSQSQRLGQGADYLQTVWVKARTRAMDQGWPQRFVVLDAGRFRLEANGVCPVHEGGMEAVEGALPEGVCFLGWQRGQTLTNVNLATPQGFGAGDALVFWPDGRASFVGADGAERSTIELLLKDRQGRVKGLHVRGVTGLVMVRSGKEG